MPEESQSADGSPELPDNKDTDSDSDVIVLKNGMVLREDDLAAAALLPQVPRVREAIVIPRLHWGWMGVHLFVWSESGAVSTWLQSPTIRSVR